MILYLFTIHDFHDWSILLSTTTSLTWCIKCYNENNFSVDWKRPDLGQATTASSLIKSTNQNREFFQCYESPFFIEALVWSVWFGLGVLDDLLHPSSRPDVYTTISHPLELATWSLLVWWTRLYPRSSIIKDTSWLLK
jgi:hypothetical protein